MVVFSLYLLCLSCITSVLYSNTIIIKQRITLASHTDKKWFLWFGTSYWKCAKQSFWFYWIIRCCWSGETLAFEWTNGVWINASFRWRCITDAHILRFWCIYDSSPQHNNSNFLCCRFPSSWRTILKHPLTFSHLGRLIFFTVLSAIPVKKKYLEYFIHMAGVTNKKWGG